MRPIGRMKASPPLSIELGRSKLAITFVLIAYLATAALLPFLPGATIYRALALVAIGAHAVWTLRTWRRERRASAIVRVEVEADGSVSFCGRNGWRCEGRLQPASYIGAWLTTVVVRVDGRRWLRGLAILPDVLPAEEWRRLPVMLRVAGSSTSEAEPTKPGRR
jgi:hypothetical protein